MNTLSRVEQPKNCDYVGWQTYGRIVKEMSWGGGLMWGSARRLSFNVMVRGPLIFVDTAAGGLAYRMGSL